jgi:hypothetical protein
VRHIVMMGDGIQLLHVLIVPRQRGTNLTAQRGTAQREHHIGNG